MKILEVNNLCKSYGSGEGRVLACDNVSFSVEKGEFTAIIGASGSGKSTLIHMLGGVDRPDSGTIIVGGKDISKLTTDQLAIYRRRQVGLVYQFYNLIPTLTVEENISISRRLDGRQLKKEELDNLLDLVGLRKRRGNLPNQLSGGEQQRTSIARALANKPEILLADEPTGNLDSKASDEIISILRNRNRDYKQTTLIITHNPEIANACDRIIEISDGRIVSDTRN